MAGSLDDARRTLITGFCVYEKKWAASESTGYYSIEILCIDRDS